MAKYRLNNFAVHADKLKGSDDSGAPRAGRLMTCGMDYWPIDKQIAGMTFML